MEASPYPIHAYESAKDIPIQCPKCGETRIGTFESTDQISYIESIGPRSAIIYYEGQTDDLSDPETQRDIDGNVIFVCAAKGCGHMWAVACPGLTEEGFGQHRTKEQLMQERTVLLYTLADLHELIEAVLNRGHIPAILQAKAGLMSGVGKSFAAWLGTAPEIRS